MNNIDMESGDEFEVNFMDSFDGFGDFEDDPLGFGHQHHDVHFDDGQQGTRAAIMKDGTATCMRCATVGVRDTFYGKGKLYCSNNCAKEGAVVNLRLPKPSVPNKQPVLKKVQKRHSTSFEPIAVHMKSNDILPSKLKQQLMTGTTLITPTEALTIQSDTVSTPKNTNGRRLVYSSQPVGKNTPFTSPLSVSWRTNCLKHLLNSYDWINILAYNEEVTCASVASFKYAPMAEMWDAIMSNGLKVEVKNTDFDVSVNSKLPQDVYWIAIVVKVAGYFVLLRYEGFANDSSKDFWVNIFTTEVYPVGWCASQGKVLIPPKSVEEKVGDWKEFLLKKLTGSRTLPENFQEQLRECLRSKFRVGMRLEVIDKKRISAVRVAIVDKVIGGRLHITYEEAEEGDVGFWCHQSSSLIHPVGWAQIVGHELKATAEYAKSSLQKCMDNLFEDDDANWTFFPPVRMSLQSEHKFEAGMKLEAIDPLNLSTICVASVMKVLRNNYLMIGIDGMMAPDGSDYFCYHSSSPCIFPVGFCQFNGLELTKPKNYSKNFEWRNYLEETNSKAAPVQLFRKDIPDHRFKEGTLLEAVDLMEPRLVCVATVTKVVGRLLRIHFNGWDDSYDQWCDCESAELFPAGWCQLVGYPLEAPKDDDGANSSSISFCSVQSSDIAKRKRGTYKARKRKKRTSLGLNVSQNSTDTVNDDDDDVPISVTLSEQTSNSSKVEVTKRLAKQTATVIPARRSTFTTAELSNTSEFPVESSKVCQENNVQVVPPDPRNWTLEHVVSYLRDNECSAYCDSFVQKNIDGPKFVSLNHEAIMKLPGMKVGPALKIDALIQPLRLLAKK
ncbi:MBT domain-containing protein 1 [Halotydeus destructor]|nr:MBT domain-containing protein 1 [Halotydeus destructor]